MRLFRSDRAYLFASCLCVAIAAGHVYSAFHDDVGLALRRAHSRVFLFTSILLTVCFALYLCALLRETSSRIERTAILVVLGWLVESIPRWLSEAGITPTAISHEGYVSAAFSCTVALLATARTLQVYRGHPANGARPT
jgi:hypothetical protein